MLRIAICDDEIYARDALWRKLQNILLEGSEEIVYDFSSGNSALGWLKKHPGEVDLLFLDVEMKGIDGMETAKRIREFDQELMIVFVTGYDDYVFDGYSVGAMDYLIKPVKEERLFSVLLRVREKIYQKESKTFSFKNIDGAYRFSYEKILYFYSEKRKVFLVTKEREYDFYDKLDNVEKRLGESFVRIHQRYLVNTEAVCHIGSSLVEIGATGHSLPISRAYREIAAKKLAKAMLNNMF